MPHGVPLLLDLLHAGHQNALVSRHHVPPHGSGGRLRRGGFSSDRSICSGHAEKLCGGLGDVLWSGGRQLRRFVFHPDDWEGYLELVVLVILGVTAAGSAAGGGDSFGVNTPSSLQLVIRARHVCVHGSVSADCLIVVKKRPWLGDTCDGLGLNSARPVLR